MKNNQAELALKAAIAIHADLIDDERFAGYDGSADAFHRLHLNCEAIVAEGEDSLDAVLDAFWDRLINY